MRFRQFVLVALGVSVGARTCKFILLSAASGLVTESTLPIYGAFTLRLRTVWRWCRRCSLHSVS